MPRTGPCRMGGRTLPLSICAPAPAAPALPACVMSWPGSARSAGLACPPTFSRIGACGNWRRAARAWPSRRPPLRRHPEATRHVWLAAYAHLRGRAVIDTLVDLLIETVHHIGARAEHKVEQELLDDLKRVGGKQSLLFDLAGAAVEKPDGTVREVL